MTRKRKIPKRFGRRWVRDRDRGVRWGIDDILDDNKNDKEIEFGDLDGDQPVIFNINEAWDSLIVAGVISPAGLKTGSCPSGYFQSGQYRAKHKCAADFPNDL